MDDKNIPLLKKQEIKEDLKKYLDSGAIHIPASLVDKGKQSK